MDQRDASQTYTAALVTAKALKVHKGVLIILVNVFKVSQANQRSPD
jgi:hypothetical protein